jgi:hypothetical protein
MLNERCANLGRFIRVFPAWQTTLGVKLRFKLRYCPIYVQPKAIIPAGVAKRKRLNASVGYEPDNEDWRTLLSFRTSRSQSFRRRKDSRPLAEYLAG